MLIRQESDIILIGERPLGSLATASILGAAGLLAAVTLARSGSENPGALFLFFVLLCIFPALMLKRTQIEINRHKGILLKKSGLGRSRVYRICEFKDIRIEENKFNLEGYMQPSYSLRIVGNDKDIELFSTDDLPEAQSLRAGIVRFLNLP
jgi:hypothetical protein